MDSHVSLRTGPDRPNHSIRRTRRRAPFATALLAALAGVGVTVGAVAAPAAGHTGGDGLPFEVPSLDGAGNNLSHPSWGQAGREYTRDAAVRYADGRGALVAGPNARYVSNRIMNDVGQNLFSERRVTHWGGMWGQFLDHTFGLRLGAEPIDPPGDPAHIPFDPDDPLEGRENTLGVVLFTRSTPAAGTGVDRPRQQVNTVSSYLDGWAVYGGTEERLEWLREGPVNGDLSDNGARLLLPGGYLPRGDARGDPATAPFMDVSGRLIAAPHRAAVTGDVRANENQALTAIHTLFAREHNRIVSLLPDSLTEEEKFQVARRVIIAEQQYITYHEFLPAMGVTLPRYTGYDPSVRMDLSNAFATVGYRAHSMIHGEIVLRVAPDRYSPSELADFRARGFEVGSHGAEVEVVVPLNFAFMNPDLVMDLELGPLLRALGRGPQYRNDEQIDDQLRSTQFEIPVPGNENCLAGVPGLPECGRGVVDLGAIDLKRGRDHGMPDYNTLRQAYGLAPKTSFTGITGEDTATLPAGLDIDDPAILDFVALFDVDGNPIPPDSEAAETEAVTGVRRTTLAARLKAVYGSVDSLDAFVGMIAEEHVPGTEFGELQLAIWTREFRELRDGDRFFYGNDPGLAAIEAEFGVDFRRTLAEIIADNTDLSPADPRDNVFLVDDEEPTRCHARFDVIAQWRDRFVAQVSVTNTGRTPLADWELAFTFPTGQVIDHGFGTRFHQSGARVTQRAPRWRDGDLAPGHTATGWLLARWDGATNAAPTHFTVHGDRCTT